MLVVTEEQRRIAARVARRYAGMLDRLPSLGPADLCQSGLLQLCEWLAAHPGDSPSPRLAWFIAKSGAFRAIKAALPRRHPTAAVHSWAAADDDRCHPSPDADAVADVRGAVASLTPGRRAAVDDWLDGRDVAESAARSGVGPGGVAVRRRRAFASLRDSLTAYILED